MSSIIEGYNYDIFISYRQKDNKHDGWVTQFVNNLKGELESTFKEEITVYFDINPHDGLLETHDVDASLKEKLKCLVFIPVISRTYCDPKSFAWEHEFKAFVEQASQDHFGLKIKLPNGNVAGRVLPVRIHELDNSDIKECESVLGGYLRGLEFIYKESGIDKPLVPDDDEKKNLNKTKYKIQIVRVVHAIKEIITGMKNEPAKIVKDKDLTEGTLKVTGKGERRIDLKKPDKAIKGKLVSTIALIAALIIIATLSIPKIFKQIIPKNFGSAGEKISVAVIPFQNMTNDTVWNIWQDGIQDMLINSLSNSEELKVRQAEYINKLVESRGIVEYASITPSVASAISRKLDANVLVYGNIKQAGNTIRLYAQLINSDTEEVVKSFQIEGLNEEKDFFHLIDSLSIIVKNYLIISVLEKKIPAYYKQLVSTSSPEAYRYFIQGRKEYAKWDYLTAINWFSKALAIDSNFIQAINYTSLAYGNQVETSTLISSAYESLYLYGLAKKWCLRAYGKMDQMTIQQKINSNWIYANYFGTPNDRIKYLKQLTESDDQLESAFFNLANCYFALFQYDKAIAEYEKVLENYKKWGVKPFWVFDYIYLLDSYYETGQYRKAAKLCKIAEQDFPDDPQLAARQAILLLVAGDTPAADRYLKKFLTSLRGLYFPEANITALLALIYDKAGLLAKAEELYRQAYSSVPTNSDRINDLAYFLIDKDQNINEALELVDKKLNLTPEDFYLLHTKGYGLFKQGKYQEALEIFQKSWDLRREKAVYDHEAYLHLEDAKKAAASQKIN